MIPELYLDRIHYSGCLKPDLDLLHKLQISHLLNIPFENLDIHFKIPIELDTEKIFNKLIVKHRGGFCYELNGLFYELLIHLGFNAKRISARVYDKTKGYGPEYDHLAILVNLDGIEYLSDVGFGEFAFTPLKLETGIIQNDPRGSFMIQNHEEPYFSVSKLENEVWNPEYIFSTSAKELEEFSTMCQYHQTSPLSHFTQNLLITKPFHNGRITLSGTSLKIRTGQTIQETILENEQAIDYTLSNYFNMDLMSIK